MQVLRLNRSIHCCLHLANPFVDLRVFGECGEFIGSQLVQPRFSFLCIDLSLSLANLLLRDQGLRFDLLEQLR